MNTNEIRHENKLAYQTQNSDQGRLQEKHFSCVIYSIDGGGDILDMLTSANLDFGDKRKESKCPYLQLCTITNCSLVAHLHQWR